MATLTELFNLWNDSALQNRITQAGMNIAQEILAEPAATVNHTNRAKWAVAVMSNPQHWDRRNHHSPHPGMREEWKMENGKGRTEDPIFPPFSILHSPFSISPRMPQDDLARVSVAPASSDSPIARCTQCTCLPVRHPIPPMPPILHSPFSILHFPPA